VENKTVQTGVRLGVDVGSVRVGVAMSDPHGILATPVRTVARDIAGGSDLSQLAALVSEHAVVEVVVGLPKSLSGQEGPAAASAREYGRSLAEAIDPVPVRFSDERFTTVTAQRALAQNGKSTRASRRVIDQVAAVQILQHYLDQRRRVE
jgi:putative Holliday junction resolvase